MPNGRVVADGRIAIRGGRTFRPCRGTRVPAIDELTHRDGGEQLAHRGQGESRRLRDRCLLGTVGEATRQEDDRLSGARDHDDSGELARRRKPVDESAEIGPMASSAAWKRALGTAAIDGGSLGVMPYLEHITSRRRCCAAQLRRASKISWVAACEDQHCGFCSEEASGCA